MVRTRLPARRTEPGGVRHGAERDRLTAVRDELKSAEPELAAGVVAGLLAAWDRGENDTAGRREILAAIFDHLHVKGCGEIVG